MDAMTLWDFVAAVQTLARVGDDLTRLTGFLVILQVIQTGSIALCLVMLWRRQ